MSQKDLCLFQMLILFGSLIVFKLRQEHNSCDLEVVMIAQFPSCNKSKMSVYRDELLYCAWSSWNVLNQCFNLISCPQTPISCSCNAIFSVSITEAKIIQKSCSNKCGAVLNTEKASPVVFTVFLCRFVRWHTSDAEPHLPRPLARTPRARRWPSCTRARGKQNLRANWRQIQVSVALSDHVHLLISEESTGTSVRQTPARRRKSRCTKLI